MNLRAVRYPLMLVLLGGASFFVGKACFEPTDALRLSRATDYWLFVVLLTSITYLLWQCRPSVKSTQILSTRVIIFGLVASGVWILFLVHERWEYKILMDEPLQVASSMLMHSERMAAVPNWAHHLDGEQVILSDFVDKRPQLFPFVVSLAHDLSGYRLENAFAVNAGLGLLFIFLLGIAAHRIGGPMGAFIAILLWAGNPEFARAMNGAGFEILNLVLILSLLLAAWTYLAKGDRPSQDLLCLLAVAVAYARYESVLFVLFAGLIILLQWVRKRQFLISPGIFASPILLIPYLWRHQAFSANPDAWQLSDRPEATTPFSLSYVSDNLGHAINYFSHVGGGFANSYWLSAIGLAGFVFSVVAGIRILRSSSGNSHVDTGFWLFLLLLFGHFWVMMAYFFGQFDDFIVSRLALPYSLAFVLCPVYALSRFRVKRLGRYAALAGAGMIFLAYGLPKITQNSYSQRYAPAKELHFAREFLSKHDGPTPLVLSRSPAFWITLGTDATSILKANIFLGNMALLLQEGERDIFLYEPLERVYEGGNWEPLHRQRHSEASMILDSRVERELVLERRVTPYRKLRISRLTGIEGAEPPRFRGSSREDYLEFRAAHLP